MEPRLVTAVATPLPLPVRLLKARLVNCVTVYVWRLVVLMGDGNAEENTTAEL